MGFARLKEEILRLLREDEEFRYAVAGLLGLEEILKRLDSIEERLESHDRKFNEILERIRVIEERFAEYDRRFNEVVKRLEEYDRKFNEVIKRLEAVEERLEVHDRKFNEITARLEEHDRKFNEILARLEAHEKTLRRVEASLGSLGARLGIDLERTILNLYKDILARLGVEGERVEKISIKDVDGRYLRKGAKLELDIYVHDDRVYFIEVKSLVDTDDVEWFETRCGVFERILGRRPDAKIIVAVNILREALERARELGIETVYGRVVEPE